eukprot:scaffold221219_cov52-Attheya_sp.AAC.4
MLYYVFRRHDRTAGWVSPSGTEPFCFLSLEPASSLCIRNRWRLCFGADVSCLSPPVYRKPGPNVLFYCRKP